MIAQKITQIFNRVIPGSLYFLCAMALFSCETVVEVNLPKEPPKLVVNGYFNPDSVFLVKVTASQHILDNAQIQSVNNATVNIYGPLGLVETLTHTENGVYRGNAKPEAGFSYRMEASASGYKTVEASNMVPHKVEVLSVDTSSVRVDGLDQLEFGIKFQDDGGQTDYYDLFLVGHRTNINNSDTFYHFNVIYFSTNDPVFGQSSDGFGGGGTTYTSNVSFDDVLFDGNSYTLRLQIDKHEVLGFQDPFGPDPDEFQGGYNRLEVHLRRVTRDYHLYNSTYNKSREVNGDPFAQPVQVHNNVDNGFGIFAGYNETVFDYILKEE